MKFERTRERCGGRQGCLPSEITRERLIEVFGESEGACEKVNDQWFMKFEDGTMAGIWDYYGARWSIGGWSEDAVKRVCEVLGVEENYSKGWMAGV